MTYNNRRGELRDPLAAVISLDRWNSAMYGFLIPLAGGDPIPLVKNLVLIGRRPDCDIRVEAANVSGHHAHLKLLRGQWVLIDLKSANGTKVNGLKINKKKLTSGDEITLARRHLFRVEFNPDFAKVSVETPSESEIDAALNVDVEEAPFKKSLLEKAGLDHAPKSNVEDAGELTDFESIMFDEQSSSPRKHRDSAELD